MTDENTATDVNQLLKRIALAENRLSAIENNIVGSPVNRVSNDLLAKKVYSSTFIKVADGYYNRTLSERAKILMCSTQQLCKSIIFENTAWVKESDDQIGDVTNSRFYLVLVQYSGLYIRQKVRQFSEVFVTSDCA